MTFSLVNMSHVKGIISVRSSFQCTLSYTVPDLHALLCQGIWDAAAFPTGRRSFQAGGSERLWESVRVGFL